MKTKGIMKVSYETPAVEAQRVVLEQVIAGSGSTPTPEPTPGEPGGSAGEGELVPL